MQRGTAPRAPNVTPSIRLSHSPSVSGGGFRPDSLIAYASNNLQAISANNCDELISYCDTLSDEAIQHAIDEVCANGAPRYSYVRATLNRYVREGLRTLGDIRAHEARQRNPFTPTRMTFGRGTRGDGRHER
ncbi:MAG: DnaD domain protein [Clostridia bacterium]|nr:DnaD domain protein [Clostridia bacterium]